jgi:drug/metabolite transporter (DMT)-like permease
MQLPRVQIVLADIFALIAGGSSIAAWQEQVEWWFKIGAAAVAIAAGLVSIGYHLRARRKSRE